MRKYFFSIALFLLAATYAEPASACQGCYKYWSYQAERYCEDCQYYNCGYFICELRDEPGWQSMCYESEDCFEYDGWRYCGPDQQGDLLEQQPTRLADKWRLVHVTVHKSSKKQAA